VHGLAGERPPATPRSAAKSESIHESIHEGAIRARAIVDFANGAVHLYAVVVVPMRSILVLALALTARAHVALPSARPLRASAMRAAPRASSAVGDNRACLKRNAVGEWEMLSGPFVGAKFQLGADGSVAYITPSEKKIWRGERWQPMGSSSYTSVRVTLISAKSGDELNFEGQIAEGGEENSLSLSGRASRSVGSRTSSRWDFAKALAMGDTKGAEDIGSFVLLRRNAQLGTPA